MNSSAWLFCCFQPLKSAFFLSTPQPLLPPRPLATHPFSGYIPSVMLLLPPSSLLLPSTIPFTPLPRSNHPLHAQAQTSISPPYIIPNPEQQRTRPIYDPPGAVHSPHPAAPCHDSRIIIVVIHAALLHWIPKKREAPHQKSSTQLNSNSTFFLPSLAGACFQGLRVGVLDCMCHVPE
jgi:hypothetical protein